MKNFLSNVATGLPIVTIGFFALAVIVSMAVEASKFFFSDPTVFFGFLIGFAGTILISWLTGAAVREDFYSDKTSKKIVDNE